MDTNPSKSSRPAPDLHRRTGARLNRGLLSIVIKKDVLPDGIFRVIDPAGDPQQPLSRAT
jgi:hypothetical protein